MARKFEKSALNLRECGPVAEAIRELREQLDLSQGRLAARLWVTANAVARWEMGDRQPDIWLLTYMLLMARPPVQQVFEGLVGKTRDQVISDLNLEPSQGTPPAKIARPELPIDRSESHPNRQVFIDLERILHGSDSELADAVKTQLHSLALTVRVNPDKAMESSISSIGLDRTYDDKVISPRGASATGKTQQKVLTETAPRADKTTGIPKQERFIEPLHPATQSHSKRPRQS